MSYFFKIAQKQNELDSRDTTLQVRLRNSAEILALGPHQCTKI